MYDNTQPTAVGISLKPQHYQQILDTRPAIDWFEIHPENYMGAGGLPHHYLGAIAQHYPIAVHGVGLSLGSADGIDEHHLQALKTVVERYQPVQVSEHLAWSHWQGKYINDLLPLPYTDEFLSLVTENIHRVQDYLQRQILLENPSAYLSFQHSTWQEPDFLNELVKRTGCGLLLDINNVYVSAHNQGYSSEHYLRHYPLDAIGEIHLAGHTSNPLDNDTLLIDDHGSPVSDAVWDLFHATYQRLKHAVPVLIEWDTDIPSLETLLQEADKARSLMHETASTHPTGAL
ncbi:MAG: DUF692 domain-containing protein [Cellvibrionaceae bacterium]|nr:DUF692 domain-containing protein [Cellvibrionaceae bacterium]